MVNIRVFKIKAFKFDNSTRSSNSNKNFKKE